MIIWLNEDIFEKTPLENLVCLKSLFQSIKKNLIFKVIGPPSSTSLLKMMEETIINGTDIPSGMHIYSATATADYDALFQKIVDRNRTKLREKQRGAVRTDKELVDHLRSKWESKTNDKLERTICSDYE